MEVEKKLVGVEIVDKKIAVVGTDLVGVVSAQHIGKIGKLKLTLEGSLEFIPFAEKAIDSAVNFVEKQIPGDQTLAAEAVKVTLKGFLAKIKF